MERKKSEKNWGPRRNKWTGAVSVVRTLTHSYTVGPAYSAPANKGLPAYKALSTGSPQKFCSYFYSGNKASSL